MLKIVIFILIGLLLCLSSSNSFSVPLQNPPAQEKVSLQLKWLHEFQFAGYYAAKEQGYYAEEGLDVAIFERSPDKDVVEQVVSGERDFAIGDSGIISHYARGAPIVALAAIFQHNPQVFISKASSGIISPYEMRGKKLLFDSVGANDAPLRAILAEANLDDTKYTFFKLSFKDNKNEALINNKVDAIAGYLSDELFFFKQKKVNINIINPQSYGFDFYGDILFTSQHELVAHGERAEKFRRASLKGWQYALDHTEELIQLIHKKYHSKLSLAHLRFEADVIHKLIMPDRIPLGHIDTGRLRKVADVYAQLKLSPVLSEKKLARFSSYASRSDDKPLIVGSEQDFPPFALGKTDDTADGFTVELWRAVAEEAHLKSTIRVLPWNQVLAEFKAEKIDVLINFAPSAERRQFADFTVPHVIVNEAIFVRDTEQSIHSEADFNHKQFIVIKGDFAEEYLQEKGLEKQTLAVGTAEAGLRLLADGHYDALLMSKIVGKQMLEKLNISNVKMLPINMGLAQKFSFAVHKGDAELLAKINEALSMVKANGTYDKLHEKWFGVYEEKQLLPLLIKYLAPVIIGFLLILLVIFYRHHLQRNRFTEQLRKNRDELLRYFQQPFIGMMTSTHAKQALNVNQRFCDIVGYTVDEMQTIDWGKLVHPDDLAANQDFLEQALRGDINAYQMEKRYIHKDGHTVYVDLAVQCIRKQDGSPDYFIGMMLDITERKAAEAEIQQLAFYDPLTGLPNRRKLLGRLHYAIALNHRSQSQFALFMMDLDKFKAVNDKLGHAAGDELLKQVAARITACLRDSDMVARLGGDEFVLVLENLKIPNDAEIIALKVIADLTMPFQLFEHDSVQIGASIGISIYPQHGSTPEILMDHADTALYQAKDNGRGCFAYFSQVMTNTAD